MLFELLYPELIEQILSRLDVKSLAACLPVCSWLYDIADSERLWKAMVTDILGPKKTLKHLPIIKSWKFCCHCLCVAPLVISNNEIHYRLEEYVISVSPDNDNWIAETNFINGRSVDHRGEYIGDFKNGEYHGSGILQQLN